MTLDRKREQEKKMKKIAQRVRHQNQQLNFPMVQDKHEEGKKQQRTRPSCAEKREHKNYKRQQRQDACKAECICFLVQCLCTLGRRFFLVFSRSASSTCLKVDTHVHVNRFHSAFSHSPPSSPRRSSANASKHACELKHTHTECSVDSISYPFTWCCSIVLVKSQQSVSQLPCANINRDIVMQYKHIIQNIFLKVHAIDKVVLQEETEKKHERR